MKHSPCALLLLFAAAPCLADTPAFDRPGIAFSTSTLAAGTYAWEQGLPDLTRDREDGVRTMQLNANTLVRVGLSTRTELQLGVSPYNRVHRSGADLDETHRGYGDASFALKASLPSGSERLSCAVLAGVGLASGQEPFTEGATQATLASTVVWALDENRALSFYAAVERAGARNAYSLSPSLGFALGDTVAAYVEAGVTHADGANDAVAGGGLAWMVLPAVQLDLYADGGLTRSSTDLVAGTGISIYFN